MNSWKKETNNLALSKVAIRVFLENTSIRVILILQSAKSRFLLKKLMGSLNKLVSIGALHQKGLHKKDKRLKNQRKKRKNPVMKEYHLSQIVKVDLIDLND